MSSSSAVMNALIAKLGADTTLLALMPNGVYEDLAPQGATRFVIVTQILAVDADVFQRRAWEDALYRIEARALSTAGGNVAAAADQIDLLLDPQPPLPPATLSVAGYTLMGIAREEFVRGGTETDQFDKSIMWHRRGGHYRVRVART